MVTIRVFLIYLYCVYIYTFAYLGEIYVYVNVPVGIHMFVRLCITQSLS